MNNVDVRFSVISINEPSVDDIEELPYDTLEIEDNLLINYM